MSQKIASVDWAKNGSRCADSGVGRKRHVALIDRLPASDGGAVEHDVFGEGVFAHFLRFDRDVLHLAARVCKAQIHEFDVFVSQALNYAACVCQSAFSYC
jgi:hypothetical protein